MTTQGMGETELAEIAALIGRLLAGGTDVRVAERVRELARAFAGRR